MPARNAPTIRPEPRTRVALVLLLLCASAVLLAGCLSDITFPDPGALFPPPAPMGDGKLRAYFLDVGQGDSTLILYGNTTILVDAGEIGEGSTVVDDLRSLGVRQIDLLVATHAHSDHIGGMREVLAAFPVGQVLDAGMPHTSAPYLAFLETLDEKKIPYSVAVQGETIDLAPGLRILVLWPPAHRENDDLNDNSVILRVSYGTVDLLLTGDAGTGAEDALTRTGYALDAEVLKVAHHGSSHSTGPAFLARVNPEFAIIPVGAGNPYGHPHAETLAALSSAGARVYRTDLDGTILVTSDGSVASVSTEKGAGARFTHATPAATPSPKTPAATRTAPGTPAVTAIPPETIALPALPLGNGTCIVIAATQFNAPGDDRENLNGEWVVLENRGDEGVLLSGWTLTDATGDLSYRFPPFILGPDRNVTVYTGPGDFNETALFMGRREPAWGNSGDAAILKDGSGRIIAQSDGT